MRAFRDRAALNASAAIYHPPALPTLRRARASPYYLSAAASVPDLPRAAAKHKRATRLTNHGCSPCAPLCREGLERGDMRGSIAGASRSLARGALLAWPAA